ncbi:hypothetical protein MTO96_034921 [Rhipicephalus appendiculatus]
MDVRRISQIKVTQALAMAAQLAPAETGEDIVCANVVQNIFVVSTPTEKNARAYARVEALLVGTTRYEVNSYLAAPDNTCKGIVWGVDIDFHHNQLRDMIVQPRNPKALEVKRIKDTTTIIVLFDGLKVPNYVMCGASMLRCTLFRRQTDVCYAYGRLGHRADVCPAPENTICRGCGTASPAADHECSPKCALCGGGLISLQTRPASNGSKCPTSSAAGGDSGNAPQKHLRRRWRPAYGPPAKVMIRASRGGAPPRRPAAGAVPPGVTDTASRPLVAKAVGLATGAPLVVAGDFNAPHCEWGYPSSTAKGSDLWQTAADHALVLLTDARPLLLPCAASPPVSLKSTALITLSTPMTSRCGATAAVKVESRTPCRRH